MGLCDRLLSETIAIKAIYLIFSPQTKLFKFITSVRTTRDLEITDLCLGKSLYAMLGSGCAYELL